MEVWKDIEGYEGLYQVSNYGNVVSLNYNGTGKRRLIKPRATQLGYYQVQLYKNGCRKYCLIHRLVAKAFVGGYAKGLHVNHIDENKSNNCYLNLEWVTVAYNNNYGTRVEQAKQKIKKPVRCIELDMFFDSVKEASEYVGLKSSSSISNCCRGKRKTACGYHWEYVA